MKTILSRSSSSERYFFDSARCEASMNPVKALSGSQTSRGNLPCVRGTRSVVCIERFSINSLNFGRSISPRLFPTTAALVCRCEVQVADKRANSTRDRSHLSLPASKKISQLFPARKVSVSTASHRLVRMWLAIAPTNTRAAPLQRPLTTTTS